MKNRLTHQQRNELMQYIDTYRNTLKSLTADSKARLAERELGFRVTAGNVYGALRLLDGDDVPEQLVLKELTTNEDAGPAQYNEISATHSHGRVRPHLLSSFQRDVETLERVRRLEVMLCKLCNHYGIERPSAKAEHSEEATKEKPSVFRTIFGGHGRVPS